MAQFYKGDALEQKVFSVVKPTLDNISLQKDLFFDGSYEASGLGEVIFDAGLSPLSNAISRDVFRDAFKQIFDAFVAAGTFESYLTVFRKIFGDDVSVNFAV